MNIKDIIHELDVVDLALRDEISRLSQHINSETERRKISDLEFSRKEISRALSPLLRYRDG